MTKVTIRYKLLAPLTDALLDQIGRAGKVYGLSRVQLTPAMDGLVVDYDASRLSAAEVSATLAGFGLPVERQIA